MANEKRLIDANALKEYLLGLDVTGGNRMYKMGATHMMHGFVPEVIDAQPTVDAVEVVHGHWTSTGIFSKKAGYGVRYYQHAECEVAPCRLFECEHDYCPNCGAKMDGGNEDG